MLKGKKFLKLPDELLGPTGPSVLRLVLEEVDQGQRGASAHGTHHDRITPPPIFLSKFSRSQQLLK